MRRVSVMVAALLVAASAFAVPASAARGGNGVGHYSAGRYIVTFAEDPVASYVTTYSHKTGGTKRLLDMLDAASPTDLGPTLRNRFPSLY